jgi:hypothetical protein
MEQAENVVLVGGPGTGKSHIATALAVQAIEQHRKKARFYATVELVNALEQEKAQGKAGQIAERLVRCNLVILDKLGYLPFSTSGGALLFHMLSKLYERASVVITTNLSFNEWAAVFGDTQNDDRIARSPHSSLPYCGNREQQLPVQGKFSGDKNTKGETIDLDSNLTIETQINPDHTEKTGSNPRGNQQPRLLYAICSSKFM